MKKNTKFLIFTQQIFYIHIVPIIFSIFILFNFILIFDGKTDFIVDSICTLIIHIALFFANLGGILKISSREKEVDFIQQKIYKAFFLFILFYSFTTFLFLLVNFVQKQIFEDSQILYLGILAMLFNFGNMLYLINDLVSTFKKQNNLTFIDLCVKYKITKREKEIIICLCEGKTNKEIAESLFITPITVRDHCSNIYRKIKVKNRTQLVRIFNGNFLE